jgi:hypothetical protein
MNCALCESPIPAARLKAVPHTQLCVTCKSTHDEPPLMSHALTLRGALVETLIGDLEEKQKDARELAGGMVRE